ncbi:MULTISPECIES: cysteine hydrolase family protein [unclassified Leucobacter]|uniref:cysteine hydrolase family protein n=1 Tax=unclassified Leucobacter TaxID=2621730 RepID=UPI000621ED11|nr:isochorismatase family cysteine hydrolase [Leucobacter sp. Ag1]KKI16577.1 isochorismatase [Leucobacter sp. Ag1]
MTVSQPRTALLLVDVINSFYEPGQPNYYPGVERTLPALARLRDTARERDALLVHAVERHYRGLEDFEFAKLPRHHQRGDHDAAFFPGFEPVDRAREIVVPKRRYSGFYATDLDLVLREQGITRVVVAGVKTNVCIRATVQDAFAGGFDVVVPREATNSNRPHLAEASLEDIERYFGTVVPTADAEAML